MLRQETESTNQQTETDARQDDDPAVKWESAIQAFEKQDREQTPQPGGTLFLGSSSIRMWKLDKSFPEQAYLNRGFGGSEISDSLHYFDRVVVPYHPRTIVFYAGDNDIANGKSAEAVFADFQEFVQQVREKLPRTRVIFIAIKPSIARWKKVGEMREANQLIKAFAAKDEKVDFADIDAPMIGGDGKPRPELFLDDGLHLNEEGYRVWVKCLKPLLD